MLPHPVIFLVAFQAFVHVDPLLEAEGGAPK